MTQVILSHIPKAVIFQKKKHFQLFFHYIICKTKSKIKEKNTTKQLALKLYEVKDQYQKVE